MTFVTCPSVFFLVFFANTEDNKVDRHGSAKPGNRSFGRFSRPLLEVYFTGLSSHELKVKSLAVADIFRYCKGFRLSYSYFCVLDQKYKRGLISEILKQKIVITHESEIWEEVSLSEVADGFEYGMNAAATSYDGEHKYIRITDIDDDSHTYIDRDPVSPSGVLEEKYRVREDDILFARTGASVGKSYLYQKTDGDLFFAGFLIRIHVKEGVESEYVFLNTLTEEYDKWVLLESARSGQPGINAEQYRQYRFKLPSLRTQKRIAAIARKFDAQIQKEIKCLCLLQEQRHGLLQQLFI